MLRLFLVAACLQAAFGLQSFLDHEVVPDEVSTPPTSLLKITFADGVDASEGNLLTVSQVASEPSLEWDSNPNDVYSLVFCDPDAPSRSDPSARCYLHWLVVNIPGGNVSSGEILASFLSSGPPVGSGIHRYVFLIYRQSGVLEFDEQYPGAGEIRAGFDSDDFANKYGFGTAVAGNFYQAHNAADNYETETPVTTTSTTETPLANGISRVMPFCLYSIFAAFMVYLSN